MASLNSFQKDIVRLYLTTKNNIAVMSSAGSGKTTLLVGMSHKVKKPHSFCFLAYTQATAEVLKKRMPNFEHSILTTYSLGYKNVVGYLDADLEITVNAYKASDRFDELVNLSSTAASYLAASGRHLDDDLYQVKRQVVDLQKLSLLNCFIDYEDILDYSHQLNEGWGLTDSVLEWYANLTYRITRANYELLMDTGELDFGEMIAWPAMWDDLKPLQFAEIFIDEFQDLSQAQQLLVFKSLAPGGQIVMVGDKSQAIYGFAGADHNSADSMIKLFKAQPMPMPINYRCAKSIIKHAQEIDPVIQAHENAPEGSVEEYSAQEALSFILDTTKPTMVLARTNLLLIKLALSLLQLDRQFTFKRDVLQERLLGLTHRATNSKPKVTIDSLPEWVHSQKKFAEEKKAVSMIDLLECLEVFYKAYRPKTWASFRRSIKTFFKQATKQSNVTLSTIHAAKGDESHTVVFWGTDKVPHRMAKTADELQQETNLEYIARTRAIEQLIRVDLG